jgi:predicted Zn-dependent peptidase
MVDRSVAPKFTQPEKFPLPKPEIINLDKGNRFFTFQSGDQPVIKLEFIFKAGLRFETSAGIAFFTAKMLTEGTEKLSSNNISQSLDQYGAFIEIQPGFDYTNLSIHIPTNHLARIKDVVKEILFHPVFPDHELDLLKQIQTQQIRVNQQKNSFVASRIFRSKLFPDNPYGHIMDENAITQISQTQVMDFYREFIKGKFDIFLTGQFNEDTKKLIFDIIENSLSLPHEFPEIKGTEEKVFTDCIEKDHSLQSAIYMGKKCKNRNHPLYPALLLLNEVFGGYFGSRLMQNIREEKGYTYSIYSRIASFKDEAYFLINSDVKKEFRDKTISEIEKEIEIISSKSIGKEELDQAKNHLKGSLLNTLTNPFAITEKLKNIYFYNLGDNFYDHLFDEIDRTQSDELLDLAKNTLFNQPLSSVVVG